MPRSQRNDNFIDKTFTVIADILLKVLPTSNKEKQAFSYYRDGMSAQSEGEYAEALQNYYEALRLETDEEYNQLYSSEDVEKIFSEVVSYHIDPDKCKACLICQRHCPVDGIAGGKNQIHVINQESCIRCGTCADVCPERFDAVSKILGKIVPPPLPDDQRTIVRKSKST